MFFNAIVFLQYSLNFCGYFLILRIHYRYICLLHEKDGCISCMIGLTWLRLQGVTVWQSLGSDTFSQSKQIGPRVAGYSNRREINKFTNTFVQYIWNSYTMFTFSLLIKVPNLHGLLMHTHGWRCGRFSMIYCKTINVNVHLNM